MSYNKIERLLKKKGWTGAEVGKALLASLLHDIQHQREPNYKPLFDKADFERMEDSIDTEKDYLQYGVYRDIYHTLVETYNRGQGLYQQFFNGYYRLLMTLEGVMRADEALLDMENYPLIMTAKQHKRIAGAAREWKRGFKTSYYALVFTVLSACIEKLEAEKPDEIPATIRKALEDTQTEKPTNKRILSRYNEDLGEGYYSLPDGRRSDKLTSEEWHKALEDLFLKTHEYYLNGEKASPKETLRYFSGERLMAGYKLFFEGEDAIKAAYKEKTGEELPEGDAAEILEELENIINETGKATATPLKKALTDLYTDETPTEWHYYEELPEGLTKYDILLDLLGRYSGAYKDDIPAKDQLKEFKADYPALYAALEAYIKETAPAAGSIKPSQIYRDTLLWGDLIDSGIIGYADRDTVTDADIIDYLQSIGACKFADTQRAVMRGIAILREPKAYQLTPDGDYREDSSPLNRIRSLDTLAESHRDTEDLKSSLDSLVIPAILYINAYNALIRIIGAVYKIDGMEVASFNTKIIESKIDAFNNLLYMFYFNVYGDSEEKARKRGLIKEIFRPITFDELKPTPEAIEALTEDLTNAGFTETARAKLKYFDNLIPILSSSALEKKYGEGVD